MGLISASFDKFFGGPVQLETVATYLEAYKPQGEIIHSDFKKFFDGKEFYGAGINKSSAYNQYLRQITAHLEHRGPTNANENYSGKRFNLVLQNARAHASQYNVDVEAPNIVVVTHPFMVHYSRLLDLKKDHMKRSANKYIANLFSLLTFTKKSDDIQTVFFETPEHYHAASSYLLANKVIDAVTFTGYSYGAPLNRFLLKQLSDKNIYLAGGFDNDTLLHAHERIHKPASLSILSDLVLKDPGNTSKKLNVKKASGLGSFPHLTSAEFTEQFS